MSPPKLPTLAALFSILLLSPTLVTADTCSPCDDIHLFLARGNNEPYPGRQAALVSATCSGLKNCGYEDLIYSALYTDLSCQTTYDGAIQGKAQMTAYAERCPNAKLILAGYSQGAQIVTDILGGGGGVSFNGCLQPDTAALDSTSSPGNKVVAAIVMGNTRHTANQDYNFANGSSIDGLFPRSGSQLTNLNAYKSVLRDWCESTDPICAAKQKVSYVSTHLGYYNVDSEAVASWIQSVASLTDTTSATTSVPLSLSGTAQNYATIPSGFTPSGTVTTHKATYSCSATTTESGAGLSSTSPSSNVASSTDTSSALVLQSSIIAAVSSSQVSSTPGVTSTSGALSGTSSIPRVATTSSIASTSPKAASQTTSSVASTSTNSAASVLPGTHVLFSLNVAILFARWML